MNILAINLAEGAADGGSGGTERFLRVTERWRDRGFDCTILGTEGLMSHMEFRSMDTRHVVCIPLSSKLRSERTRLDRAKAYLATISNLRAHHIGGPVDVVYSSSDFAPDVYAAARVLQIHPKAFYAAVVHHRTRLDASSALTSVVSGVSSLAQRVSWTAIGKRAQSLHTYATPEGDAIARSASFQGVRGRFGIRNGVDVEQVLAASTREGWDSDILISGGLRWTKGLGDLVPLATALRKWNPNIRIVWVGHGTDTTKRRVERDINSAGLSKNIRILGGVPKAELYGRLKGARVVVSLSREEGWGIAIREACAAGARIVAYSLPAFGDLGSRVVQVPQGNLAGLVTSVIKQCDEPQGEMPVLQGVQPGVNTWEVVADEELQSILDNLSRLRLNEH